MLCDESTSIDCARVMRGTSSSASDVDAPRGERLNDVGALARAACSEMSVAPSSIRAISLGARRLHLGDDVRAGECGRRVGDDRRAGRLVGVVAKAGAEPGAALHDDFEFQLLDQPRHLSGASATRCSRGAVSVGTLIFMKLRVSARGRLAC